MPPHAPAGHPATLPPARLWMVRGFSMIARRRLRGAFRALRLANADALGAAGIDAEKTPLVVYLNHPSWWDPLVGFVLAERLFGGRPFAAPMDAEAVARYRILGKVGMFPVDMGSPRGAAQFLRTADAVLDSGHVLGVTPQGRFTDVRERPITLRPGLAALLERRADRGQTTAVLPVALEYPFWNQRLPEALALLSEPLQVQQGTPRAVLQAELEARLTAAQERLAELAAARDPAAFTTVVEGRSGSAGAYSLWEDLQRLLGRRDRSGDHRGRPGRM